MVNAAATAMLTGLAPGRVELAIGSGFSGRFAMGKKPNRWAFVAEYAQQLVALLAGETVWYAHDAVMAYKHEDSIPRIQHPCLVPANTGDAIYAQSKRTMDMRPDFAYAELEGGTIDIIDEQPVEWSEAVAAFLFDQSTS